MMQTFVLTKFSAFLTLTALVIMSTLGSPPDTVEKHSLYTAGLIVGFESQASYQSHDIGSDARDIADSKQLAAKEAQRKRKLWKDILVYSCFVFSLIMLLWMRKRRISSTKVEAES